MWVRIGRGVINMEHVAMVTPLKNLINLYGKALVIPKPEDLVGQMRFATEDEANAAYAELQEKLGVWHPPHQQGAQAEQDEGQPAHS